MKDKHDVRTLELFTEFQGERIVAQTENAQTSFNDFKATHTIITVDDVAFWGLIYKENDTYTHPTFGGKFKLNNRQGLIL